MPNTHRIHHSVGDREYLITVDYDTVSIVATNASAKRTCIAGWESIPSICRSRKDAIAAAMTELWAWTTCEREEYLAPAIEAARRSA